MVEKIYEYRDPARLTAWVRYVMIATIVLFVVSIVFGLAERSLLVEAQQGTFDDYDELFADMEASDTRIGIIGIAQFVALIASVIIIGMWTYRVGANAHTISQDPLEHSAGSGVWWYFVPFANLWKPYQALREFYVASAKPRGWTNLDRPAVVPIWWTLWIVSNIADNVTFRLALNAEELSTYMFLNGSTLVSDALNIPLCAVFIVLSARLCKMQTYRPQDVF